MSSFIVCGGGHEEDTRTKTRAGSNRNTLSGTGGVTGTFSAKHGTTRGHRIRCGCCLPVARPLKDTLKSKAKPIHTIPSMKLTSRNAKEIICRKRFGVLVLFAFSGMNKPDFAPNATSESHGSRVGGFTTASPVCWVVQRVRKTASYFIQSATTRFIASIFPSRNRVSPKEAFEGLELCAGKLACTVLRGLGPSNGARLLDSQERRRNREATVYLPALGGDGPRLDRTIRIYKCSQASSAEESLKCCAALLAVSTEA